MMKKKFALIHFRVLFYIFVYDINHVHINKSFQQNIFTHFIDFQHNFTALKLFST